MTPGIGDDLLTRTTLQVEGGGAGASLVAAAENVGVRVSVVSDTRAPLLGDGATARVHSLDRRKPLIAAAVSFVVLSTVDLLLPDADRKHGILIVVSVALWAFFLAKSFMVHR